MPRKLTVIAPQILSYSLTSFVTSVSSGTFSSRKISTSACHLRVEHRVAAVGPSSAARWGESRNFFWSSKNSGLNFGSICSTKCRYAARSPRRRCGSSCRCTAGCRTRRRRRQLGEVAQPPFQLRRRVDRRGRAARGRAARRRRSRRASRSCGTNWRGGGRVTLAAICGEANAKRRWREQLAIHLRGVGVQRGERWILRDVDWTVPAGRAARSSAPTERQEHAHAHPRGHLWPTTGDVRVLGGTVRRDEPARAAPVDPPGAGGGAVRRRAGADRARGRPDRLLRHDRAVRRDRRPRWSATPTRCSRRSGCRTSPTRRTRRSAAASACEA